MFLEYKLRNGQLRRIPYTWDLIEIIPGLIRSDKVVFGSVRIANDFRQKDQGLQKKTLTYHEIIEEFRKEVILTALEQNDFNQTRTARALGIGRKHLYSLTQKFGINNEKWFSERKKNDTP